MVGGIGARYQSSNHIQGVRAALGARTTQANNAPIATAGQALDAALNQIASGPAGLGVAHRDLGRRLNDQLVGDVQPTASVVAGVDAPCRAIDTALDGLRKLESTRVVELNTMLARAALAALPAWTPTAGSASGPCPPSSGGKPAGT